MGAEPSVLGEIPDQESGAVPPVNPSYNSLLEKQEYARLAHLLEDGVLAAKSEGPPIAASLTLVARQLCQACLDCQEQEDRLQQLHETAVAHECDLRQTLQALLILLDKVAKGQQVGLLAPELVTETAVPAEDEVQLDLWSRIKSFLGPKPASLPAEPQTSPEAIQEEEERLAIPSIPSPSSAVDQPSSAPHAPQVEPLEDTSQAAAQLPSLELESPAASASLVAYCLGSFRVYQNNELITEWDGLMGQKILKYLVAQRGKPVPKEVLMELMWADVGQEAQRRNLHQAIYSLRQTLRRREPNLQHILFQNDNYLLNPATDVWIDFVEFEAYAQSGQRLEAAGETEKAFELYGVAEGLYQGAFLEEDLYEEWTKSQHDYLHNLYLEIADRLSEHFLNRRDNVAAIALCQKALGQDPYFEAAHRRLMLCYCEQGLRHLAVRQYQICVDLLATELGLEPDPETTALYQEIT